MPDVKAVKMGIAMPVDQENKVYLTRVLDGKISWAVSPILATESVEPRAYDSALNQSVAQTISLIILFHCVLL